MDTGAWSAVEDYVAALLVPRDEILDGALDASAAAGLPPHQVSAPEGKLLHLLASIRGARTILEIGTLGGYSTIWLARALPPDGRLVTLEAEPLHAEVARANLAAAGLGERVEVRAGNALGSLRELEDEGAGPFDFVFVDADKKSNPLYLEAVLRLTRPGSVVVADNVVRGGSLARGDTGDATIAGLRRFLEMIAADARLTATVVQTVGSKGHDGFLLAVVGEG
ncbi:MAG TPA: O-methyltransferase [Actinomycetota bacterium]|nr:O-methyltransferase [Actinomycetota bacterium]